MGGLIATLTLNPALDIASQAEKVVSTHKVRTSGDRIDPGGGGINVARVVHALGGKSLALIAAGGVTGRYVEDLLDVAGVARQTISIAGRTRICLTVFEQSTGLEYRFVPKGPVFSESEWLAVLARVQRLSASWLVLSGSLPPGVPTDAYRQITMLASQRGISVALDSSGPALAAAIGAGITLVKPSLGELEALVGRRLEDPRAQEREAMALVEAGAAAMVAVTLGRHGALLAGANGVVRMPASEAPVRTAVGAGDSFMAALVLRLAEGYPQEAALSWAIAAGTTAVAGVGTADVDLKRVVERLGCSRPLTHSG